MDYFEPLLAELIDIASKVYSDNVVKIAVVNMKSFLVERV
jgi:hypothetical protein